mmetsp:Transcript_26285/g.88051  ORF Transcript_26285/g.88051 Transcript_26285/m.88051 type:complete len:445 (-) Transcript_26285:788-2122(-)
MPTVVHRGLHAHGPRRAPARVTSQGPPAPHAAQAPVPIGSPAACRAPSGLPKLLEGLPCVVLHILIPVGGEGLERWPHARLRRRGQTLGAEERAQGREGLGRVEPDVGHRVGGEVQRDGQPAGSGTSGRTTGDARVSSGDRAGARARAWRWRRHAQALCNELGWQHVGEGPGAEERGHAVQVVGVPLALHELREAPLLRPVRAENPHEFCEVCNGHFADRVYRVCEPRRAERRQLPVKELRAQLLGKQGDVLDDGEPHAPLTVLGELHHRGEKALREEVHADDRVHLVQSRDHVEAHLGVVVSEEPEHEGQEAVNGVPAAEDGGEAHDHRGHGGAHVLGGVLAELLHAGEHLREDDLEAGAVRRGRAPRVWPLVHGHRTRRRRCEPLADARGLEGRSGPHLGLVVPEQLHEGRHELRLRHRGPQGVAEVHVLLGDDVPHAPRLV